MTQSDAHGFIAAIAALSGVELVLRRSDSKVPEAIQLNAFRTAVKVDRLFYALVHKDHLSGIVMDEVRAQGYWEMNTLFSPVVEFTLSYHIDAQIRPGRLWYERSFYDASGRLTSKPALFLEWAGRAFRVARSRLKKYGDYRCGPEAYELLQCDRIRIIN